MRDPVALGVAVVAALAGLYVTGELAEAGSPLCVLGLIFVMIVAVLASRAASPKEEKEAE